LSSPGLINGGLHSVGRRRLRDTEHPPQARFSAPSSPPDPSRTADAPVTPLAYSASGGTSMRFATHVVYLALSTLIGFAGGLPAFAQPSNPILFVTQVPAGGFTTVTSTFGNQLSNPQEAPRGGDLVIRYSDGTLRFLTQEAGFGDSGMQGANAIAVREPCVHWNGNKALFSMLVGAPTRQYQLTQLHWQIYEVEGLTQGAAATIRRIGGQPANFNNVSPIYATDGRILFTSDRPASGATHHYPQRDEYESAYVVAGIYSLDETTGELKLLEHSPSGSFSLSLDSFGRVIFTKWDHLQRDQQGDAPSTAAAYKAFTYSSEAADAATTTNLIGAEMFPEPRTPNDPAYSPALATHRFNHFFPWEMNEDGSAEETLNHIGRHEIGGSYTDGSFTADSNLTYYVSPTLHANRLRISGSAGLFHFREDPLIPGDFLATYAPEFGTATGGTLMRLTAAPSVNPEEMLLTAVTPTGQDAEVPEQTGYFRNPLPMSDGTLVAVHTPADDELTNQGSTQAPNWSYEYRLKVLTQQGNFFAPAANLTGGIQKSLSWWTPDALASYDGVLWELDPVEVVARSIPQPRTSTLPEIEAAVFAQEQVDVETFRAYLRNNGLALIVSRDVTQRDRADRQQPFNLRVPGGVSSVATGGTVYDVAYLQIFQADAVRGYGDLPNPRPGRRLLARPMHEADVSQTAGGPEGAVSVAPDGSIAALVPAQRALTWQLTDQNGSGVVRERNWISFQSGEIRVCANCHGVNTLSQTGDPAPVNEPQALRDLLALWKQENGVPDATPTSTATLTPTPRPSVCSSGIVIERAALRARLRPAWITLSGRALIPQPWVGVAPHLNGVQITLDGVLDVTVPGGAGWTMSESGDRWLFSDRTGQLGGIRRIEIVDRSTQEPGLLVFSVRIAGASYVPTSGPASLSIRLGSAEECASKHWPHAPRCDGRIARLRCR
jgi:hypothetical protein